MLRIQILETEPVLDDETHQPVIVNGKPRVRPKLDADKKEITRHLIEIPPHIEEQGGDAIDAYVAAEVAKAEAPPAETPSPATSAPTEPPAHPEE